MLPAVASPRRVRALGRYRPAPVGVGGDGLGSPRRGGGEGGEKRSNEAAAKQAASSGGARAASTQPVCARVGFSPPTRPARAAVPVCLTACPAPAVPVPLWLGWAGYAICLFRIGDEKKRQRTRRAAPWGQRWRCAHVAGCLPLPVPA